MTIIITIRPKSPKDAERIALAVAALLKAVRA